MATKMQIEKGTTRNLGSCNFCNGFTDKNGKYSYKYKEVISISGCGIGVRLCNECLEHLMNYKDVLDAREVTDALTDC